MGARRHPDAADGLAGTARCAARPPYLINAAPWWRVSDEDSGATNRAWRRFIFLNYFAGFLATMILILAWVS